jgi:hypothetical protein
MTGAYSEEKYSLISQGTTGRGDIPIIACEGMLPVP